MEEERDRIAGLDHSASERSNSGMVCESDVFRFPCHSPTHALNLIFNKKLQALPG